MLKFYFCLILFLVFLSSACSREDSIQHLSSENDYDTVNVGNEKEQDPSDYDISEKDDDPVSDDDNGFPDEDSSGVVAAKSWKPGSFSGVIITTEEFAEAFERLAVLHSMTGVSTGVVTIKDICDGNCNDDDSLNDTPSVIKDYIASLPDIFYVVLGGDIDDVPSRQVYDEYSHVMAGSFSGDFYTDYYYSDLSEWDTNGDGIYAEEGVDAPEYRPDVAVGRISVSTVEEVDRYIEKVVSYMTDFPEEKMLNTALIANVATEFSGVQINAGYYFEAEGRTVDIVPPGIPLAKLYADTFPKPSQDMEVLNVERQKELMESGQNIIVHNGHGYPTLLSAGTGKPENNFTAQMGYELQNDTYFIFLSCACQAGQFEAPFTYTYTDSNGIERTREFTEDAAGEQLINAPDGGAVAYLGNTTTGLGLAGGSQLIDEMVRHIFHNPSPRLGDALFAGQMNLKEHDTFKPPVIPQPIPVVDPDSYRWTQKSVVLLGDPIMPVWNVYAPKIDAPLLSVEFSDENITVHVDYPGDIEILRAFVDNSFFSMNIKESETFIIPVSGDSLSLGASSENHQYYFRTFER